MSQDTLLYTVLGLIPRLAAISHQPPTLLSSQGTPVMTAGSRCIASPRTAQKTRLPSTTPLLRVTQGLSSNGCFSGSTFLTLSRYATIEYVVNQIILKHPSRFNKVCRIPLRILCTSLWKTSVLVNYECPLPILVISLKRKRISLFPQLIDHCSLYRLTAVRTQSNCTSSQIYTFTLTGTCRRLLARPISCNI
jgi:hypothetical protein